MKKYIHKIVLLVGITTLMASCKKSSPQGEIAYKEPSLPETPYDYTSAADKVNRNQMKVTDAEATLGRVLFYEKALSVNNLVSCGSCHVQSMGFADGRQFSPGFEFTNTPRNSPAIINPGVMNNFFWDARVKDLEEMVTMPVQNHLEMGIQNLDYAVEKINSIPYYAELFTKAYGTDKATKESMAKALANFLASMTITESRYDKSMRSNPIALNEIERHGQKVFSSLHCNNCHSIDANGSAWTSNVFANIGLDMEYKDEGIVNINNTSVSGSGLFKTPSLQNIALTAPYMHDGRFATLEEVIEHYNSGVQPHPALSWSLTNHVQILKNQQLPPSLQRPIIGGDNDPVRLNLTELEKKALVAFLNTLTDDEFTKNPMYSDPFNY